MKKVLISIVSFIVLAVHGYGQVPVATKPNDQIVQGPCYIFATVAALESKALHDGVGGSQHLLDIYEWNLYSKSVLGSRSGNGHNMVTKVLGHANSKGVYSTSSNFLPQSIVQLPNVGANEPTVKGIADFTGTGCNNNFNSGTITYKYIQNPEVACLDDNGKNFGIEPIEGTKYTYNHTGLGYVLDTTPTAAEMRNHLNVPGRGLIAFFDDWDGAGTSHAVFIYGYTRSGWKFKDSWPGNPGIKTEALNISDCSAFYYLTGTVNADNPNECSGTIAGNATVSGSTTYSLSENSGSSISNTNWSVSSNLSVISQSNTSITVKPYACGTSSGSISATYTKNQIAGCSASKAISVTSPSSSLTPTSISVKSMDWNGGATCSNTILELEAIDNNLGYPNTTYNWSISGATLLSGQGTPTVFVRTSSNLGTTYLTFKVRAKNGTCAYSGWRTIYGQSSSSNCSGGGQLRIAQSTQSKNLKVLNIEALELNQNELQYQIISMDGKAQKTGCLDQNSREIDLNGISHKLVILKLYSADGKFYQSTKHIIN